MKGRDSEGMEAAFTVMLGLVVNLTAQGQASSEPVPRLETGISKQVGSRTWVLRTHTHSPWMDDWTN